MKFCFWGNISGALKGKPVGGGEHQLSLIIKNLNLLGEDITIIDTDITEDENIDGLKILSLKKRYRNRFVKFIKLYKLLVQAKADIYYARIRTSIHLLGIIAARHNKTKFIYHVAHDLDTLGIYQRWEIYYKNVSSLKRLVYHFIHSEIFFPFVLKNADLIIAQHKEQKNFLYKKGIKNVVVIPNLIEFPVQYENIQIKEMQPIPQNYYIVIGSLDKRKGIKKLELLIKNLNQTNFLIIGHPRDKAGRNFIKKIIIYKNSFHYPRLEHKIVLYYLAKANGLISTSLSEGFPNVFIEAWSLGIPVYSLYANPSKLISDNNLGRFYEGNIEKMISELGKEQFSFDKDDLINYVHNNHSSNTVMKQLLSNIKMVITS